jgi:DNA-directed RNA polymerase specialized sigma24 family protein
LKRIAKQRTLDWHRKYRNRKRDISLSALLTEEIAVEGTSRWIEALLSKRPYPIEDESTIEQETENDAQGTRQRRKKPWERSIPAWGKHMHKGLEAEWILWEDEKNVRSANWWMGKFTEGVIFDPFNKTLPPRTKKVIQLQCRGYNANEIAQYLGLQKRTVYDHLKRGKSILIQWLRRFSRNTEDLSLTLGMIEAGKTPVIPNESEHLVKNFCKKLVP